MHGKLYNSLSKEDFIVEERRVPVVTITNGVFLQKSYEFRSEFKKSLKADFSGRKEKINFTDSYEAMQKINWWIKEKTNDLIPNFITSKNELPKDTKIILANILTFKDLVAKAQVTGVALRLPRFKIESQINLIPYMQTLGIQDLFTRGLADLSGITDSDKLLFVNLMKQSSVLKVNEEGVEAAAVTGMAVVPLSLTVPKVEFHVNHPFVCFIYDRELRLPLFAARVTNPQQP
ncbi:unnamed protein product [Echinostoma caproni]|uniref:SERPIN domain-containing protein n=1 Tax=Echinostoma caproni TaxID=27848 RepID=A0A183B2K8_9TREM|nr:unnamed protein product [Echinostoma caproni]